MALATITTKGQVTIPKEVREALNLHSGDKIEILVTENGEAVIRPISKKVDDLFCSLKKPNQKVVSVEEMNQAIVQRFEATHP